MARTTEQARVRRETLRLLAEVEKEGIDIVDRYQNGRDLGRARYQDFRRFVEKVDHFYVFIDLVEERLPQFDPDKQEALAKHLAEIRWRIVIVEVDTTQVFLLRIGQSRQPWPLGSREFLQRRLVRLGEIAEFYNQYGERYQLPALGEELLTAVTELLKSQIARAPGLEDFTADAAMAEISATPAIPRRRRKLPAPASALPTKPRAVFRIKEMAGRYYADRDAIVAVADACRVAQVSMDQLAVKLGISRPALVLILNGTDPMSNTMVEQLRGFVTQQALA